MTRNSGTIPEVPLIRTMRASMRRLRMSTLPGSAIWNASASTDSSSQPTSPSASVATTHSRPQTHPYV